MKFRCSLKKICEYCKFKTRKNKLFVLCEVNPKHKQKQRYSRVVESDVSAVSDCVCDLKVDGSKEIDTDYYAQLSKELKLNKNKLFGELNTRI
mmetsp:Transcript_22841/g.23787  ORF Transcript_22841/g.23787 Transcript_22841/m.23787 type:complete len:93 (+) Transcript_22841:24-302(+)